MKLIDIDKLDLVALAKITPDLDELLNEDAVLDLSYSEKVVYKKFYEGATDKEISEATGVALSTVIWMRYSFWERARSAVVFSLLAREMTKGMPPKRINRKSITRGEMLPVINDDGIVIDLVRDKYALHLDGDKARKHASVIILVGYIEPFSSELVFFVADKASKMLTVSGGKSFRHAFETVGGHAECHDACIELGKPMPLEKAFQGAAKRELHEELYIKQCSLDMDRLHYLYTDHYDGVTKPFGRNIEISGVFIYAFNGKTKDISSGDVRFKDSWRSGLLGLTAKKEWIAKPRSLSDLLCEYDENPGHFCDALSRCLLYMRDGGEEQVRNILEKYF
jgi:hypothetical protein